MPLLRSIAWCLGVAVTASAILGCAKSVVRHGRGMPAPVADTTVEVSLTETIGYSIQGRPIEAISLGGSGQRILLIGGIHGDETEGGQTIAAIIAYLRVLEPDAAIRVVRDINPDGTAARRRVNANGVDLNRN